jgi:uncharacterized DUF497 family protein
MTTGFEWDESKASDNFLKHGVTFAEKAPSSPDPEETESPEMMPEYRFDYQKARPNRFARSGVPRVIVVLDPDVAVVFRTAESVNSLLRALITTMPQGGKQ